MEGGRKDRREGEERGKEGGGKRKKEREGRKKREERVVCHAERKRAIYRISCWTRFPLRCVGRAVGEEA